MRVLYLANAPRPRLTGAASRALAFAAVRLRESDHLVVAGPPDSALELAAVERDIPFRAARFGPGDSPALRALVREVRPDVVHAMSAVPLVLAQPRLLVRSRRADEPACFVSILVDPSSSLVYSDGKPRPATTWARNRLLRRISPHLDAVLPVSTPVAAALERIGVRGRFVVVGGMLDIPGLERDAAVALPLPAGRPLIGTAIGQLERLKGVDHLVRAFASVLERHPDAQCVVAGEGAEREALQTLASELGVADRLHLLGYLDRPARMMARLDVYVSPSLTEGLGSATAEAMALGIPVVSTDVGGVRDIVTDGETGLLVPPADAAALAGAVERILADDTLARALGEAGRRDKAARCDREIVCRLLADEYERAMERGDR